MRRSARVTDRGAVVTDSAPQLRPVGPLDELLALARRPCGGDIVLSGNAGTGKTTLVKALLDELGGADPLLLAPTGKAALRLAEVTGRPAMTIHRALYGAPSAQWVDSQGIVCKGKMEGLSYSPPPCEGCDCVQRFAWMPSSSFEPRLVIVDEASMVGATVATDLRQAIADAGGRLLWVGDPGQLPPVGDPPGVDLEQATVHLSTVHRSDRPGVLSLATRIREARDGTELTRALTEALEQGPDGVVGGEDGWAGVARWRAADWQRMLVVHRNADRQRINADVRDVLGCRAALHPRELVLVRKNEAGLLNGQLGRVQRVESIYGAILRVVADFDGVVHTFALSADCLAAKDNYDFSRRRRKAERAVLRHGRGEPLVNAQYGYALTCHAAQGSEADHVGIVWTSRDVDATKDETRFDTMRRWLYTAVTRARLSVTIWVGP